MTGIPLGDSRITHKRCKQCGKQFHPRNTMEAVCSPKCALEWIRTKDGEKHVEKAKSAATRKQKQDAKTLPELKKEAQAAFNRFIRARDAGKPCICCGKPLELGAIGGGYDCGHYRSVGSAPHLRFDERNAHGQRKQCNRWGAGRAVDYRIGLIARIGLEAVEALESDQAPRKYSREDLIEIAKTYRAKARELERARS